MNRDGREEEEGDSFPLMIPEFTAVRVYLPVLSVQHT